MMPVQSWWFSKKTKASQEIYSSDIKPDLDFYMVVASQANTYPIPLQTTNDEFKDSPKAPLGGATLYDFSHIILQEFVREQLQLLNARKAVDLVLFGGNQVYTNDYYDFFKETIYDLQKYYIPSYITWGPNEMKGEYPANKISKNRYYLLKTKTINILILDNVTDTIVPENLPEEANEQYVWLTKVLDELNKSKEDILIFSYYPLDEKTKSLFNRYTQLSIKLTSYSSGLSFEYKDNILSIPSLTNYPCSYAVISKDNLGNYKVEQKPIGLKSIQRVALKRRYPNIKDNKTKS